MNAKTDVSDANVWNAYKFQKNTEWIKGDFTGNAMTDVSDWNIWMQKRFTSAPAGLGAEGGCLTLDQSSILVAYNPATGVMTCDTAGADINSLLISGPQALRIDRWLNETYQDGVYWTQQYFDTKEQWGGTNQRAVPRTLYEVATYATGLTAQDFGQVEFSTLDRQILYTTVEIVGGLSGGGAALSVSLALSTSVDSPPAASALASWLYEYEPTRTSRPSPQTEAVASAVDQVMASY